MSSPAVQLSFTLRTSPNVRTVHLLGSWDNYKSQLPLAGVKDPGAKPGSWKGTFRFQGSHALKLGSRYWYYYIVDGYHVSHDPAKEYVTEKSTGRKLNILDVPSGKSGSGGQSSRPSTVSTTNNRHSRDIVQGRALSPGKIQHPKPSKPYASQQLREADYEKSPIDDLEERFAGARLGGDYNRHAARKYSNSPSDLSDDSASSGTVFSRSSPSDLSSSSDRSCRCDRYGLTRSGQRVKLDCGGARCGYGSGNSSSECSSETSDSDENDYKNRHKSRVPEKSSGGRHDPRRHTTVERRR